MIPADEKGHEPDTHTGKCVLDLDNTGGWLVCTKDPAHLNRKTALRSLYDAGLLRAGGYAEREVLARPDQPRDPAGLFPPGLFGGKEDGDE